MKKILLVGFGNLGFYYLKTINNIKNISQCDVYDKSKKNLERINKNNFSNISKIKILPNLENANNYDLCIVSTKSDVRYDIIKTLINQNNTKFLTEKILFTNYSDHKKICNKIKSKKLKIWVNFNSRILSWWKYLKKLNQNHDPISLVVDGGSIGLCTSGIHILDLFEYLTDHKINRNKISLHNIKSFVNKKLHYDLSGSISYKSGNKSLLINFENNYHNNLPIFIFTNKSSRFILQPNEGIFIKINLISNKIDKKINLNIKENLLSHYSKNIIENILFKNKSNLPLLEKTTNVHRIIYDINAKYFVNKKNLPT